MTRTKKQIKSRITKIDQLLLGNRNKIQNLRPDERTQRKFNLWAKRDELVKEKTQLEKEYNISQNNAGKKIISKLGDICPDCHTEHLIYENGICFQKKEELN